MMHRRVRKKSLYTGDTSDTNPYLLNQVTQPIVHVLDEWAKVALDSTGRAYRRSDWLRKTSGFALIFRLPTGFRGLRPMGFLDGVDSAVAVDGA